MISSIPLAGLRPDWIVAEVETIPLDPVRDGSGQARGDDTRNGWIGGLSLSRIVEPGPGPETLRNDLDQYLRVTAAVDQLMRARGADRVHQLLVNRLEGGRELEIHRDGRPFEPPPERWHLPVWTNPLVEYWEEGFSDPVHLSPGSWWGPISYWNLHSMRNLGGTSRVHLIVDLLGVES